MTTQFCNYCGFQVNNKGYCGTKGCSNNAEENFCEYCGEPLEDGMYSAKCDESAEDEGRDDEHKLGEGDQL